MPLLYLNQITFGSDFGLTWIIIQISGSFGSVMLTWFQPWCLCMYVYVHACMYVYVHACMYVCIMCVVCVCVDGIPVFIDSGARHDKPLLIRDTTFTSRISAIII